MIQQCQLGVLAINILGFGLAVAEICQTFWPAAVPRRHSMSKICQTAPSQHCNITHWTHMDEMKWFSSAMLPVLAANNLGFAWLWLRSAKLFGQQHSAKET